MQVIELPINLASMPLSKVVVPLGRTDLRVTNRGMQQALRLHKRLNLERGRAGTTKICNE
jgi:hypothetical protein